MHIGQITTCYNFKFLKKKYISNKKIQNNTKRNYTIITLTKQKMYISTTSTKPKP